jgi:hypothetical protein
VYNYPEGSTENVSLENLLPTDVDLGTIVETSPLDNQFITDIGSVADIEIPNAIVDLGTLV